MYYVVLVTVYVCSPSYPCNVFMLIQSACVYIHTIDYMCIISCMSFDYQIAKSVTGLDLRAAAIQVYEKSTVVIQVHVTIIIIITAKYSCY